MKNDLKIIECPRDAMQGIHEWIPTQYKVDYINQLLKIGFDTIDFGSFVSSKSIPQMKDTTEVLDGLDLDNTNSKLLAIVANTRGAKDAAAFDEINYLGFPFSVSETFQKRNTNSTIEESLVRVEEAQNICATNNKELVVYLSMAFGNPYEDKWDSEIVWQWTEKLHKELDVNIIAMSDTIGVSNEANIKQIFDGISKEFSKVEFGAHLHTTPDTWKEKIESAYSYGCRRFDAAIKGYGGCPMAADKLTGNMPTEKLLSFFNEQKLETGLDTNAFSESMIASGKIFDSFS